MDKHKPTYLHIHMCIYTETGNEKTFSYSEMHQTIKTVLKIVDKTAIYKSH